MDSIDMAVRVLQRDGLVVYPTETVYGLGADAHVHLRIAAEPFIHAFIHHAVHAHL